MRHSSQRLLSLDGLDFEVRADEREHQALHVLSHPHNQPLRQAWSLERLLNAFTAKSH